MLRSRELRQAFCRFGDFAAAGEASSLKTRARAEELSNSEARAGPEMQRFRRREKTYVKVVSAGARKPQKEQLQKIATEDLLNRASRARRGSRNSQVMFYHCSLRQECHGGSRRATLDPCFCESATGARSDDVAAEELEDTALAGP